MERYKWTLNINLFLFLKFRIECGLVDVSERLGVGPLNTCLHFHTQYSMLIIVAHNNSNRINGNGHPHKCIRCTLHYFYRMFTVYIDVRGQPHQCVCFSMKQIFIINNNTKVNLWSPVIVWPRIWKFISWDYRCLYSMGW